MRIRIISESDRCEPGTGLGHGGLRRRGAMTLKFGDVDDRG